MNTAYTPHSWGVHTFAHEAPRGNGYMWGVKRRGQAARQAPGVKACSSHAMTFQCRIASSKFERELPGCYEGVTVEL